MSVEVYDQLLDELLYLKKDIIEIYDQLLHFSDSSSEKPETPREKKQFKSRASRKGTSDSIDIEIKLETLPSKQDSTCSETYEDSSPTTLEESSPPVKSKRGRPPGSLNKKIKTTHPVTPPYVLRSKLGRKSSLNYLRRCPSNLSSNYNFRSFFFL
jgi:hypothetical protein